MPFSAYVEEMYNSWKVDPNSVHKSWDALFRTGQYTAPPSLVNDYRSNVSSLPNTQVPASSVPAGNSDSARVVQLVRAFQVRGHLMARIDPLNLMQPRPDHEDLNFEKYGFSSNDLDRVMDLHGLAADIRGFLDRGRESATLRHILQRCEETYCSTIGYEYMHIPSVSRCNWIRDRVTSYLFCYYIQIETQEKILLSKADRLTVLQRLCWADHFEGFLSTKFASAKRFGLEGGESLIAGMEAILDRSADLGVESVALGMPHRGR